ncbi:unnamed protein product [Notodromas monacha]|uniref:Uncharacterized protein n=1 Tax=Notodromas monacha TaxID=399045 RepID=A0A7R9GFE5_9CRUS|nr:unnamed protein product [Notodromas monacha]CAG0920712.1 unnamed protein product [Notodromas monacha]
MITYIDNVIFSVKSRRQRIGPSCVMKAGKKSEVSLVTHIRNPLAHEFLALGEHQFWLHLLEVDKPCIITHQGTEGGCYITVFIDEVEIFGNEEEEEAANEVELEKYLSLIKRAPDGRVIAPLLKNRTFYDNVSPNLITGEQRSKSVIRLLERGGVLADAYTEFIEEWEKDGRQHFNPQAPNQILKQILVLLTQLTKNPSEYESQRSSKPESS